MGSGRSRGRSLGVIGIGLALLILGSWSGAQFRRATLFSPFFFAPSGLALSPDGEILIGVQASRIHLYDDQGRFLWGWGVSPEGGPIRMQSLGPSGVEVARQDQDTVSLYDYKGNLTEEREDPAAFEALGADHDRRIETPSGVLFEMGPAGLYRVAEGQRQPIVSLPPWPLSLFGAEPMIPVALVMTLGAVVILVGVIMTADLKSNRD